LFNTFTADYDLLLERQHRNTCGVCTSWAEKTCHVCGNIGKLTMHHSMYIDARVVGILVQ